MLFRSGTVYKAAHGNAAPPTLADTIRQPKMIDIRLPLSNIASTHPLYDVVEPLVRALKQDTLLRQRLNNNTLSLTIHVVIQRDDTGSLPLTGSETFFTIEVSFEDQNGALLVANRIPLRLASYGTMFPREMGTFALMVPNGLSLDGNAYGVGDITLASPGNWNGGPNTGLIFKSPVFVNGDIHLPYVPPQSGGHYNGAALAYTPVTFADRVILGNGWVYEGSQLYKPESAGGKTDTYWADNRLFGGFKMGVAVDNSYDKGLLMYGSGTAGVSGTDLSAMQACLARNSEKSNSSYATNADLYAGADPSVTSGTHYEYVVGDTNFSKAVVPPTTAAAAIEFNPQTNSLQKDAGT